MSKKGMLGSGSKGTTRNPKLKGAPQSAVNVNPSMMQPTGGVLPTEERARQATTGTMLHKQLKANKSKGMGVP
jgi:hypothetical protein